MAAAASFTSPLFLTIATEASAAGGRRPSFTGRARARHDTCWLHEVSYSFSRPGGRHCAPKCRRFDQMYCLHLPASDDLGWASPSPIPSLRDVALSIMCLLEKLHLTSHMAIITALIDKNICHYTVEPARQFAGTWRMPR